jgi:hypothetical protein
VNPKNNQGALITSAAPQTFDTVLLDHSDLKACLGKTIPNHLTDPRILRRNAGASNQLLGKRHGWVLGMILV